MTAIEYLEALSALGWKQADLCRRIEVSKNTASRWGQDGPPAWVGEYLGVMLALDALHRRYIRPPKPERQSASGEITKPIPTGRAARMAKQLRRRYESVNNNVDADGA